MKTKHRHDLKENDLALAVGSARQWMASNGNTIAGGFLALVVVGAVVLGILAYRNREQSKGQDLLAEAMVVLNTAVVPVTNTTEPGQAPAAASITATGTFSTETQKMNAAMPKLRAAADAYPDTVAGITARYHLASSLATIGKQKEAIAQFDEVVKRAGPDSLYGRMAQLGKADAQVKSGEVDSAIATWKALAAKKDANLPEDAILMELARAYQTKGDVAEARKAFSDIVDNHPDSPYVADARKELDSLKG